MFGIEETAVCLIFLSLAWLARNAHVIDELIALLKKKEERSNVVPFKRRRRW